MSQPIVEILVIMTLFVLGVTWTVWKYSKHERLAFTIVAVLSPVLAVVSLFALIVQAVRGDISVGPCPDGLDEAERAVELEHQRLFGGKLREPTFARAWQRAYEMELQREAEGVKKIAQRVHA